MFSKIKSRKITMRARCGVHLSEWNINVDFVYTFATYLECRKLFVGDKKKIYIKNN